jgi:prophage antirepressor-like protein
MDTELMTTITVQTDDYNSLPITRIELDGKSAWIAREIGRALGYARGGEKLSRNIARRWTKDFAEGVDYDRLTGELLERLRGLVPRLRRTRRVMILFRSGLDKVLARASFDIAYPLRIWLEDRLPARGEEGEGRDTHDLFQDRRLRLEETREARLASEQRARGLLLLLDAIAETATEEEMKVYQIKLAQELAGRDFTSLLPPKSDKWTTPTQIAKRNETSVQRVGRIITELGLRDQRMHPDDVEAYDNLAPGTGRLVTCYRFGPYAVEQIEGRLDQQSEQAPRRD